MMYSQVEEGRQATVRFSSQLSSIHAIELKEEGSFTLPLVSPEMRQKVLLQ